MNNTIIFLDVSSPNNIQKHFQDAFLQLSTIQIESIFCMFSRATHFNGYLKWQCTFLPFSIFSSIFFLLCVHSVFPLLFWVFFFCFLNMRAETLFFLVLLSEHQIRLNWQNVSYEWAEWENKEMKSGKRNVRSRKLMSTNCSRDLVWSDCFEFEMLFHRMLELCHWLSFECLLCIKCTIEHRTLSDSLVILYGENWWNQPDEMMLVFLHVSLDGHIRLLNVTDPFALNLLNY